MKKKILILDDKETIAKVLSIYLMSDYDVQWLPDGLQGGSSRTNCSSRFQSSCFPAKTPPVSASACWRLVPKTILLSLSTQWS